MKIQRECEECGALCLDDGDNLTPVADELIEQQAARIAELEQQVSMLRTGDMCARMCEGTAYRIGERQAKARVAELEALLVKANDSWLALSSIAAPVADSAMAKDAERYRWIRDDEGALEIEGVYVRASSADDMDAEVDRRIAEKGDPT